MPGNGFSFPVRVRSQKYGFAFIRHFFQLFHQLFFSLDDSIFRLKMLFHIHTEAVFRQISDMAHGCDNVIAFSQIFLNGFRLGRRLHNY